MSVAFLPRLEILSFICRACALAVTVDAEEPTVTKVPEAADVGQDAAVSATLREAAAPASSAAVPAPQPPAAASAAHDSGLAS